MALPNLVQIKQALDKMMPELSPVPIGSTAYAHEVPTGWLECNGAAISRTKYARLFKKIGTKYGAGDGSTTFNLPNLHHRVLEATTTISEVAKMVEAGLPDITGKFWDLASTVTDKKMGSANGCFRANAAGGTIFKATQLTNIDSNDDGITIEASRSSAIFGQSDTVRMASLRALAIIKT
mgnify:CR=1 FL=1